MKNFFVYNWQVRDEWFLWSQQLTLQELVQQRTGGVGSILHTLFHIVEVEYSWIRAIQGEEDILYDFSDYKTLNKVSELSNHLRMEIIQCIEECLKGSVEKLVNVPWDDKNFTIIDILHHLVAHEIHHIGQLSIWSREMGMEPVPANYIGRKLFED
ncbi:damage-inducible protein DinB [Virgibacillus sp. 7505]|uniref:DinB family protein n=1 Tax=Virgibacillus sp. 7505 TaxID=2022548 RepID=UPI000BA6EF94|nr:DinB family protein [Virgibacillus sp. 7505]PAE15437.1 damage-inducible protein DinB [Virgibacillus sp. 7505]